MTERTQVGVVAAEITILYRNYRGETSVRRIVPQRIWFGATEWHPGEQWLMDAIDVEKNALRSFAMRDILDFDPATAATTRC